MSSYIGQSPVFGDFPFQILSGDGTPSYTMSFQVSNENGMLVFLNGAVQRPGIDFTAGGTSLVFSESIPLGVQIFAYGMGLPKSNLSPSNGASLATPTQFDDSQKIATTEFVQRAIGNKAGYINYSGSSVALTAADAGKNIFLNFAGTVSVSLPAGTTAAGLTFNIICGSATKANMSITGSGTFAAPMGSGSTASVVAASTSVEYSSLGSANSYLVMNGAGAASFASNGYQRLPSGLIMQWGSTVAAGGSGAGTATFPIAFPTAALNVQAIPETDNNACSISAPSTTSVVINGVDAIANVNSANGTVFRYLAIGY